MTLKAGDRVRLSDKAARTAAASRRGHQPVWITRVGTIVRITERGMAMIKWDGRVSLDQWPASALVKD